MTVGNGQMQGEKFKTGSLCRIFSVINSNRVEDRLSLLLKFDYVSFIKTDASSRQVTKTKLNFPNLSRIKKIEQRKFLYFWISFITVDLIFPPVMYGLCGEIASSVSVAKLKAMFTKENPLQNHCFFSWGTHKMADDSCSSCFDNIAQLFLELLLLIRKLGSSSETLNNFNLIGGMHASTTSQTFWSCLKFLKSFFSEFLRIRARDTT